MKKTLKKALCGVCSAAMLLGAVSFSASAASGFTDVKDSDYFAKPVEWAVQNGVTAGVGDGKFGPNQSCTRAQAMTFLWRAAGSPEPTSSASFSDVSSSDYYAKPVAWAVENGITAGVGDGEFGADDTCTRGQIMTFLWRFGGSEEVQGSESFSDVSSSDYFAKPVAWAVANNVTAGIGGGKFGPNQSCTRGQIMTMLWRADQIDTPVVPDPEPTDPTVPETTEPTVPETTAPTEPEPTVPETTAPTEPSVHEHDWVHEHTDEVGHWGESKFVCQKCGWYCTESQAAAEGMNIIQYWTLKHQYSECGGSYEDTPDWIVDVPASDKWTCSGCGEVVTEDPTHEHRWVHGAFERAFECVHGDFICYESQAEAVGMNLVQYWGTYHQYSDTCDASYDEKIIFVPAPDSLHPDCWYCADCDTYVTEDPTK